LKKKFEGFGGKLKCIEETKANLKSELLYELKKTSNELDSKIKISGITNMQIKFVELESKI
jgi:hypothetical protein